MGASHHPDRCGPSYRYPRHVRDLAFQLWAFKCSRRLDCVEQELAAVSVVEGWDCAPGERTLRHWATKGDWPAAAVQALHSVAPDMVAGLVTDLIAGAVEATPWVRDVLAGRVTNPNSTRMRASLTVLSMVGVPDLAHGTMREAMRERNAVHALPAVTSSQAEAPPAFITAWKEQLATRLGLTSQAAPVGDDAVPSPGQGEGADGRE